MYPNTYTDILLTYPTEQYLQPTEEPPPTNQNPEKENPTDTLATDDHETNKTRGEAGNKKEDTVSQCKGNDPEHSIVTELMEVEMINSRSFDGTHTESEIGFL